MRIAVIWFGLFVCPLVLSETSDQDVVTVTEYVDIHENDNNYQHSNTLCGGVVLVSNVSDTMIAPRNMTENGTPFGNTFRRIEGFLKIYNSFLGLSNKSVKRTNANTSFELLNEQTKIELLTAIKALQSYGSNSRKQVREDGTYSKVFLPNKRNSVKKLDIRRNSQK